MTKLPFKYMSAVSRKQATNQFVDAEVDDGYLYELDGGNVLSRSKMVRDYNGGLVNKLLDMDPQDIRLMAGEMTQQEMRTVRAVLAGIKAKLNQ